MIQGKHTSTGIGTYLEAAAIVLSWEPLFIKSSTEGAVGPSLSLSTLKERGWWACEDKNKDENKNLPG